MTQPPSTDPTAQTRASHPCPICGKPVTGSDPLAPFCSARCKTIDLGRWADQKYKISRPVEQSDLEET